MYWLRSSVGSDLLSLTANRSRSVLAVKGPLRGPSWRTLHKALAIRSISAIGSRNPQTLENPSRGRIVAKPLLLCNMFPLGIPFCGPVLFRLVYSQIRCSYLLVLYYLFFLLVRGTALGDGSGMWGDSFRRGKLP